MKCLLTRDGRLWLATAAALLLLSACAGKSAAPEPTDLPSKFVAGAQLNPRADGTAQNVDTIVVQLTSVDKFRAVDLLAMYPQPDKLTAALGDTLVASNRLQLRPSTEISEKLALEPRTRFVGVIAAFEQYHRAVWRADVQVKDETLVDKLLFRGKQLVITVDALSVSASLE